ncbi:hypothetical protein F5Y01DRAFT_329429 [Xylaria sp. FL0043]|nr:hypothetical protein F5Y01DRAFT_329429 [Xylaria sp. FL0043]
MEQVAANHGEGIKEIRAPCVEALLKRPLKVKQPPTTFQDFHNFPDLCGFPISEGFALPVSEGGSNSLSVFIQAWLFFGLILTVVQIDEKPVLQFDDLLNHTDLSTERLHGAIERWTEWEVRNQRGARFRMIQVGWVLDFARHVIQKNFAYDFGNDADTQEVDHYDSDSPNCRDRSRQVGEPCILVLMCLGETLSAAKARIVGKCKVDTNGWHGDDNVGWGPPKYVFDKMKADGWCPRALAILRGQVNSNATMLVAAYQAYQKSHRITPEHSKIGCTPEECKMKSTDGEGNYENRHIRGCKNRKQCKPCGPPEGEVIKVLQKGLIPLLEFCDECKEGSKFRVVEFDPIRDLGKKKFVTISHVWSDGWGNEKENRLNECQIKFIQRQIQRATESAIPFWMDTLVVPVAKGQEEQRKKAIRQIFKVFGLSALTIILDNGLLEMGRGGPDKPAEAAMKIFSSVWMRRLWTLQEAYLSKEIYIPFEETPSVNNLVQFDKLEQQLEDITLTATSGITQMIRAQLSYMVLGEERRSRNRAGNNKIQGGYLEENNPMIVANAYRAARWRATGKAEHEVLALATLLKLDTEKTEIENAGLAAPGTANGSPNAGLLEELVCVFWYELHRQRKGIIPSGMIFLPGEKVNRQGFGWAPKTWFSTYEMDYPDPLNFWNTEITELSKEKGLRVSYPGFLLHPSSRRCRSSILGTSMESEPFVFPVDRSLNEWYGFQRLDDPEYGQPNELTRLQEDETPLAIILSGPLPKEFPKEVALLVELAGNPDATLDRRTVEYRASVIHRVRIWREPSPLKDAIDRLQFKQGSTRGLADKDICLGEALGPSQRWWVDRPVNPKIENVQEETPLRLIKRTATNLAFMMGLWGSRTGT